MTLDEIQTILDQKNIINDCVTINGTYDEFIDPFVFCAATKGNDQDVLSYGQMLWQSDHEEFLKTEVLGLKGLDNFGVFKYFKISDILPENCSNLLNVI